MNSSPDGTECDENADCVKPIGEQSTQISEVTQEMHFFEASATIHELVLGQCL